MNDAKTVLVVDDEPQLLRLLTRALKKRGLQRDAGWISRLRGLNLRNGGMVALDYRTGDILAYVGSAGYYRKSKNPKFDPQYDHVGLGKRQPGSAWKPIVLGRSTRSSRSTIGFQPCTRKSRAATKSRWSMPSRMCSTPSRK